MFLLHIHTMKFTGKTFEMKVKITQWEILTKRLKLEFEFIPENFINFNFMK